MTVIETKSLNKHQIWSGDMKCNFRICPAKLDHELERTQYQQNQNVISKHLISWCDLNFIWQCFVYTKMLQSWSHYQNQRYLLQHCSLAMHVLRITLFVFYFKYLLQTKGTGMQSTWQLMRLFHAYASSLKFLTRIWFMHNFKTGTASARCILPLHARESLSWVVL